MRYWIMQTGWFLLAVLNLALVASAAESVKHEEARSKDQWVHEHLLEVKPKLPFSFVYDGQASARLLPDWTRKTETRRLERAQGLTVKSSSRPTAILITYRKSP